MSRALLPQAQRTDRPGRRMRACDFGRYLRADVRWRLGVRDAARIHGMTCPYIRPVFESRVSPARRRRPRAEGHRRRLDARWTDGSGFARPYSGFPRPYEGRRRGVLDNPGKPTDRLDLHIYGLIKSPVDGWIAISALAVSRWC